MKAMAVETLLSFFRRKLSLREAGRPVIPGTGMPRFALTWIFTGLAIACLATDLRASVTYDAIYVFGDSYSDAGNDFSMTKGFDPAAPNFQGRFSNGRVWIEHVAAGLNLPVKASLLGGTDYAYGGAKATGPVSRDGLTVPSIGQQVENYLSQHGGKADPKALYVLEGGGNDILDAPAGTNASTLASQVASAMSASELLLRRAGATHIVIPTLFDVGKLPAAKSIVTFAHTASLDVNSDLNAMLVPEESLSGIHLMRPDWYGLIQAVATDPNHYGFTNLTTPCFATTVCSNPFQTWYWDLYHPTIFGHIVLAVQLEVILSQQTQ
jgi:phospholipase/lecithinase/hemolysin